MGGCERNSLLCGVGGELREQCGQPEDGELIPFRQDNIAGGNCHTVLSGETKGGEECPLQ